MREGRGGEGRGGEGRGGEGRGGEGRGGEGRGGEDHTGKMIMILMAFLHPPGMLGRAIDCSCLNA